MKKITIDQSWSLFLDRDGVINRRIPGEYVKEFKDFLILEGVLDCLSELSNVFCRIVVVTNQQGIGKGLMTAEDLDTLHEDMKTSIADAGGRIDAIYYCGQLSTVRQNCRKPRTNMAVWAKRDFDDIQFQKSIMVGDSITDMDFGKRMNMTTVLVGERLGYSNQENLVDYHLDTLAELPSILNY